MPGRDSLGAADGGTLAGYSRTLPQRQHLLASSEAVDGAGRVAEHLEGAAFRTGRAPSSGLGRGVHGRHLRASKKGGASIGKTKRGKGTKLMVVADGKGIPLGISIHSASPAEVTLAEETLDTITTGVPKRLIADKAYDSAALRRSLDQRGIEQITPHKSNRVAAKLQDGRPLRRYRRRWKIERTIAWIGNFRRLVVRYDRDVEHYKAFVLLACIVITSRYL